MRVVSVIFESPVATIETIIGEILKPLDSRTCVIEVIVTRAVKSG